jgi:hypothetical protein
VPQNAFSDLALFLRVILMDCNLWIEQSSEPSKRSFGGDLKLSAIGPGTSG